MEKNFYVFKLADSNDHPDDDSVVQADEKSTCNKEWDYCQVWKNAILIKEFSND